MTLRAMGPFDRMERWFGTGISFRHVIHRCWIRREHNALLTEKRGAVMTSPYRQMTGRYVHLYTQTKTPLRQNFVLDIKITGLLQPS